ncbi:hypothetical protein C5167_047165 [Papaver somniferum]|uniref:Uncharacterized protein n=1 Tax=Papaver somniferum TaxID=3469 RepID=A0A4Y7LIR6_PAPSO|nr:hypothetical protein C5167_047165 [Papaver somniferum]
MGLFSKAATRFRQAYQKLKFKLGLNLLVWVVFSLRCMGWNRKLKGNGSSHSTPALSPAEVLIPIRGIGPKKDGIAFASLKSPQSCTKLDT